VEDAAGGHEGARDEFARLYLPVVRAYLGARWRDNVLRSDVDDAAQEVFVDFIKPGGALSRVNRDRGGFRAFLFGVTRIVARRHEERNGRRGRVEAPLDSEVERRPAAADGPSKVFDRAWARAIMRAAHRRHARRAEKKNEQAVERVELLRLRFEQGLPIREIAARWGKDAGVMHHQYAQARLEFSVALYDTVAVQHGGSPAAVRRECGLLLGLLG
jgi:RNA polymerase sigma factor (sigma-70 family)